MFIGLVGLQEQARLGVASHWCQKMRYEVISSHSLSLFYAKSSFHSTGANRRNYNLSYKDYLEASTQYSFIFTTKLFSFRLLYELKLNEVIKLYQVLNMKHGLWHGYGDTTRHGHSDTVNVKIIRHRHRYIFIKNISLELKIHTYASKLNNFFNKKSFKRILW
jgi:hypothetical protein